MFLLVCMFPGWVEAFLCHKDDALMVAKKLLEHTFPPWGVFSTIASDQGTHFTGQII